MSTKQYESCSECPECSEFTHARRGDRDYYYIRCDEVDGDCLVEDNGGVCDWKCSRGEQ